MLDAVDEFLGLLKEGAFSPPKPPTVSSPGISQPQTSALRDLQKRELDLWHHWNSNGRKPEHLKPLYESYKPLLQQEAKKYVNRAEVPTAAIHGELNKLFVHAVKSYDPSKAKLNSWVTTRIKGVQRFVRTYQNIGRISERQIDKIKDFNQAKDELRSRLGYEPDTKTLAEHLKWPEKRVADMHKALLGAMPSSSFEGKADPIQHFAPREIEAIHLVQYGLAPQERTVWEYTFGMNGRPMLKPGEISRRAGINLTKVSRIRKKLHREIRSTLNLLE